MNSAEFATGIKHAKPPSSSGGWWSGCCSAHDDKTASLGWSDGGKKIRLKCLAGCSRQQILGALGLNEEDTWLMPKQGTGGSSGSSGKKKISATYDYRDEKGALLYQEVRYEPKSFSLRRPHPDKPGHYIDNMVGARLVLFQLDALQGQQGCAIVEGAKDAIRLTKAGLLATTNPMGAGNWRHEYAQQLVAAGARVALIFPDNDPAGEKHEAKVRDSCLEAGLFVIVVRLPGLGPKGDVSDYLDTHTIDDLFAEFSSGYDAAGVMRHPATGVVKRYFPAKIDLAELQAGLVGVSEYEPDAWKPKSDRDVEVLTGEQMQDMASCWEVLLAKNSPPVLFRYGEAFVRLVKDTGGTNGSNGTSGTVFSLRVMNPDRLRLRLAESAVWMGGGDKQPKPIYVPDRLLSALLASDERAPLPLLHRVITAPVFTAEGRLIEHPGYDPDSRILYLPPPGFVLPPVPEIPTDQEVTAARDLILNDLMVDFPFVSDADKAAAVATFLTPFARGLFRGPTPLFLFHKPEAGTGASKLMDMFTLILTGAIAGHQYEPTDEAEWRKMITAALLESPAFVFIDNLKRGLNSSALAMLLTSEVWTDRELGVSRRRTCPNEATWFATGNNPEVTKENSRRVMPCRMNAQMEKPWLRDPATFKHPELREWVEAHRGELVHAALVLVQNWIARGRQRGSFTLGSYERWAQTLSGILDAASVPGLGSNLKDFYATADRQSTTEKAFIEAWWAAHDEQPTRPKDMLTIADNAELKITGVDDRARARSLGGILKKMIDKTSDLEDGTRVVVEALPEGSSGSRYRLKRVSSPKSSATSATTATSATPTIDPDDPANDLEPPF